MIYLKKFFASPKGRLVARAILAGVVYFASSLQTGQPVTRASLVSAAVGAAWAVVEYLSPLNALVGPGKKPPPVQ